MTRSSKTRWAAVKHQNKERLSLFVERQLGVKVDADAMFDVQIKRLHEYKRQHSISWCYSCMCRVFWLE
jgi:starch phosphorylase